MNMIFRLFLISLVAIFAVGCVHAPHGPTHRGGYYGPPPQGANFQPGDYALEEGRSIKRVMDFASCDGEGFAETRADAHTSERNAQRGGYDVRLEMRSSCTKMGGEVIPPRGIRRSARQPGW